MLRYVLTALIATLLTDATTVLAQSSAAGEAPADTANRDVPSPFPTKRRVLGYGRLTSNDVIGDGQDRWRTGSVTMSRAWGYTWNGTAPSRLGELLETRVQGQIIAPDNLQAVNLKDRPYAGVLTLGVHTYASNRGLDYSLGLDLAIIGPQTRLDQLQVSLHKLFGKPPPSDAVLALQIPNEFRLTFVGEIGRTYRIGETVDIRPFTEVRAGDETLARVGVDISFGSVGRGELLSRESITGQRYRLIYDSAPGLSFVVGGDMAYVANSVYLPEARGYQLSDRRDRLRAGVHWQGENASAFYGVTYLSPEFAAQKEGQVAGSIRVKLRF
jgi:outer membrane protein LpxR